MKWNPVKAARGADKCLNVLKKCAGFMRVMPVWPRTLAVFDTLENARAAKEKITEAGELTEARMNRRSGKLEVKGRAEEETRRGEMPAEPA